jgi:hypothetical protein
VPSERGEEGGFLPRMPESLEQLDLLLMEEVRARKVRRDGIHFHGLRYLSLTLAAYVGEDVTIRFDRRDMGEIRVSTRIASFVRRSLRNWQERRFPCETSFACATNVDANSARSSTIGKKWSIPYYRRAYRSSRAGGMQTARGTAADDASRRGPITALAFVLVLGSLPISRRQHLY